LQLEFLLGVGYWWCLENNIEGLSCQKKYTPQDYGCTLGINLKKALYCVSNNSGWFKIRWNQLVNCLSIKQFITILMSYYETGLDDYDVDDDVESEADYDFED